ncbi:DNAse I-like superfamily protein, partial [Striga hermonthica]
KKSRFHFDKRWIGKEGFEETVQHAWKTKVSGTPFYQLKEKIKHVRTALLIWSSKFQTQNQALISQLTNKLQMLNQDKSGSQWESWENTRRDLEKAHRQEEMFWQQKARLKWLREGDSNTRFFHTLTLQRRRFNAITRLLTSRGQAVTNQEDIASHIAEFYKNLFSSEGSWGGDALLPLIPTTITSELNDPFFSKNTPLQLQHSICQTLNGITSHKSTRYLGLPLGIGKSKKEVFDYILTSV